MTPVYFHQHMLSALHDRLCLLFALLRASSQHPPPPPQHLIPHWCGGDVRQLCHSQLLERASEAARGTRWILLSLSALCWQHLQSSRKQTKKNKKRLRREHESKGRHQLSWTFVLSFGARGSRPLPVTKLCFLWWKAFECSCQM